jgi:hypothetical protein
MKEKSFDALFQLGAVAWCSRGVRGSVRRGIEGGERERETKKKTKVKINGQGAKLYDGDMAAES